ncbi:MAG: queuosine precursor transporter [Clostridiales Family XIII bacterium]|jgi:uncharacterized integral membrane protein (TIGR00697 family)|nr:queuosine precursor transporter [Clostridiales Family XIII bacterium]
MNMQVPENPVTKNRDDFTPLVIISCILVTCYLTANIMAVKLIGGFGVVMIDAGTITFPISYLLGDVLTEIWGFKTARKIIFLTFACNVILVIATFVGVLLPSPDYTSGMANSYDMVFSYVPRIVVASLIAFLCGELTNSYVMVKIKEWTKGRFLWIRTIGSSMVGYVFDTGIFLIIAFAGTIHLKDFFIMLGIQYAVKVVIEAVIGTPLAYLVIGKLKKRDANSNG